MTDEPSGQSIRHWPRWQQSAVSCEVNKPGCTDLICGGCKPQQLYICFANIRLPHTLKMKHLQNKQLQAIHHFICSYCIIFRKQKSCLRTRSRWVQQALVSFYECRGLNGRSLKKNSRWLQEGVSTCTTLQSLGIQYTHTNTQHVTSRGRLQKL